MLRFSLLTLLLLVSCAGDEKGNHDFQSAYKLYQEGRYVESLPLFLKSLENNPDNLNVRLRYGNALEDSGDIDSGIAEYQKVLSKKSDHILALISLGNALRKQGRIEEGVRYIEKAVTLKPGEAWMRNNLGNVYEELGRNKEAHEAYTLAVTQKPHEYEFRTDLANYLLKNDRKSEALYHFEILKRDIQDLLKTNPDAPFKRELQFVSDMSRILRKEGVLPSK